MFKKKKIRLEYFRHNWKSIKEFSEKSHEVTPSNAVEVKPKTKIKKVE